MTATSPRGRVVRDADGVRLEFSRTLAAPVEQVWSAVTDPERLAQWFGRWTGDPATGEVELVLTAEGGATPERVLIRECDPPRRLAVTAGTPERPWPLLLVLAEDGAGTALHFEHRLAEADDATDTGPGWQFYLDRLTAVVAGEAVPEAWEEYHPALAAAYAAPGAAASP